MGRTIIVSNRLPLQIIFEEEGFDVIPSVGGLATGLKSFHQQKDALWIGWPGLTEEEATQKSLQTKINEKLRSEKFEPVYLTADDLEDYYYGFSNRVLWPLFHYFTEYTRFNQKMWKAYQRVNQIFAEQVLKSAGSGDTVWVHDYHLMLLPQILRKQRPDLKIGFFLHIPFPAYEVFRILPVREEILRGLLGADLAGFHTYDYQQHFLHCAESLTGATILYNQAVLYDHMTTAGVYPMGIDVQKFENTARHQLQLRQEEKSDLRRELDHHKERHPGIKLILSIDRLDYTKGIAIRIKAFDYFLKRNPEYHKKVRLVMLAVPSRTGVPQYQKLKREVDELVGRINGRYAMLGWNPIWYFFRSMPFEDLIDLYTQCDIALLTPLRDGMNLVAKEYIISRVDQTGVLILSEMAGAAHEMSEALLINPNNFEQINHSLIEAITMAQEEQKRRNAPMQERLKKHDIRQWAKSFMDDLQKESTENHAQEWDSEAEKMLLRQFQKSKKPLIFLSFDGTTTGTDHQFIQGIPGKSLLDTVRALADENKNNVVIISNHEAPHLLNYWGDSKVTTIAEQGHSIWSRKENISLEIDVDAHWKNIIRPLFESYRERVPGSLIEEKERAMIWDYKNADPEEGSKKANELSILIRNLADPREIALHQSHKSITATSAKINKGWAAAEYLEKHPADFILIIGDDSTDELMFLRAPENAITIRVGFPVTHARYFLHSQEDLKSLLKNLKTPDPKAHLPFYKRIWRRKSS